MERIKKSIFEQMPFFVSLPAILWQVIFLWLPLFFMIFLSIFFVADHFGFTLKNYVTIFNITHWYVIGRSLAIALTTTILCLLCAYPVAYYIARQGKRAKTIFLFFLALPFWVNFLIHIYAWFFLLDFHGVINSLLLSLGIISSPLYLLNSTFAIVTVMFYCYLPFMVLPVYTVIERFDTRLLEAAADLGASPQVTFRAVTLPLTLSGIRSGVFLVFITSFGEYAIPLLMGGGKKLYVGSLISDYVLIGQDSALGSAFTVLSSIVLIITVGLINFALSKKVILKTVFR